MTDEVRKPVASFLYHLNQFALLRNADSLSTLRGSVRRGSDRLGILSEVCALAQTSSEHRCLRNSVFTYVRSHSLPRRALRYPQGEASMTCFLHYYDILSGGRRPESKNLKSCFMVRSDQGSLPTVREMKNALKSLPLRGRRMMRGRIISERSVR